MHLWSLCTCLDFIIIILIKMMYVNVTIEYFIENILKNLLRGYLYWYL
jgi:hypothetical protein